MQISAGAQGCGTEPRTARAGTVESMTLVVSVPTTDHARDLEPLPARAEPGFAGRLGDQLS